MLRVAVIGGGPAGFMAAAAARESAGGGVEVEVLDAGVPLATILRTGGGRCNLANAIADPRELSRRYPRGGAFLLPCFTRFGSAEARGWFTARGLPLVEEDEGRVFPRSGRADDVRAVLEEEARGLGVRVHAREPVTDVRRAGAGFTVATPRGAREFDRVVIATGGDWRDRPGSGYRLARGLGHAVTPLAPSLTGLVAEDRWVGGLAGLTLRGAAATARFQGREAARETGDLLFTHDGVSGPLAFKISARCAFLEVSRGSPILLGLSLAPGGGREEAEARLRAAIAERQKGRVLTALASLAPRSLAEAMLGLAGIDPELPCSQLTREGRRGLSRLLESLPITIVDRVRGGEMVSAGGVALAQVDHRTMGSRLVPGLFFCGEVLDVDGFTGGFNLQAAWTTGRIAGLAAGA
jgi:predicted Rossmann fold flavoprotein